MIKKERKKIKQTPVEISWLEDYSSENMETIYLLYISTIAKKQSQAYLNKDFFQNLKNIPGIKILVGKIGSKIMAMSIFFESKNALYGRYWGINPQIEKDYPLLHFEMCYYRGMDYIFEKEIPLFEAGAQGEQKLWRGFSPIIIKSAHHLKREDLFAPIKEHINEQNQNTLSEVERLKLFLPFKAMHEKA
jgi:predicted N-acyltransferase